MIRLLLRLFKITDFEPCASCETLKKQLEFERAERQKLLDTVLDISHPKSVPVPIQEDLKPVTTSVGLPSRRRAILEERDRQEARTAQNSIHLAQPDTRKIQFPLEVQGRKAQIPIVANDTTDTTQGNTTQTLTVEQLEKDLGIVEEK